MSYMHAYTTYIIVIGVCMTTAPPDTTYSGMYGVMYYYMYDVCYTTTIMYYIYS
jgi:hypothetical protein